MRSLCDLERNLDRLTQLRDEAFEGGFQSSSVFDDEVWGLAFLAVGEDQASFDDEVSRVRGRIV